MTDPAEAGSDLKDPNEMNDNDNDDNQPMTTDNELDGLKREINMVLPGDKPLDNLRAIQTGPAHYTVLSARNGNVSTHRVDVQAVECSCKDMTHNTRLTSEGDEGREICAHIAFCMLEHPQMNAESQGLMKYFGLLDNADRLGDRLSDELDTLEGMLIDMRDGQAGQASQSPQSDAGGSQNDSVPSPGVDPAEAAEKLQQAYDDVIEHMNVQHSEGYVWVQTGKDTPDTLPGPGNVEVFDAFLRNPDHVEYIHDDHDDVSMKPGEWWKNRIDPSDVDDYIDEVLK